MQLTLASPEDFNASADPSMTLHVGNTMRLYRRQEENGTVSYILEGDGLPVGAAGSKIGEDDAAAYIPIVVALRSLVQGSTQVQAELRTRLLSPAQVDAALATAATPGSSGSALLTAGAGVPPFGLIRASATAVGQCGNGVCEFGEAPGSWAYTSEWHCAQDCPFELAACPVQVRCGNDRAPVARNATPALSARCRDVLQQCQCDAELRMLH